LKTAGESEENIFFFLPAVFIGPGWTVRRSRPEEDEVAATREIIEEAVIHVVRHIAPLQIPQEWNHIAITVCDSYLPEPLYQLVEGEEAANWLAQIVAVHMYRSNLNARQGTRRSVNYGGYKRQGLIVTVSSDLPPSACSQIANYILNWIKVKEGPTTTK
jgi:hypothetical protein